MMQPPRTRFPGVKEAKRGALRDPRLCPENWVGTPSALSHSPGSPGAQGGTGWVETHLLLPDALHTWHRLIQSVDGFPASHSPWPGYCCRPQPLPHHLPAPGSVGSGGISPRSPRRPSIPEELPHITGLRYVIPAGATSLLLFPPTDPWQCPSSLSPHEGWIPQGRAPPNPGSVSNPLHRALRMGSPQGHRGLWAAAGCGRGGLWGCTW